MTTFAIYAYLFGATALYAALLAWKGHLLEPDLTWLEVVVGVAICLIAPYADQRLHGPLTSEMYEHRVWTAFLVGGAPIILWQLGQGVRARLRVERRIRGSHDNTGHTTDQTAPLAGERRSQQEDDD